MWTNGTLHCTLSKTMASLYAWRKSTTPRTMYYFGLLNCGTALSPPARYALRLHTHVGGFYIESASFPPTICLARRCPLWKAGAILIPRIHRSKMLGQLVSIKSECMCHNQLFIIRLLLFTLEHLSVMYLLALYAIPFSAS
jgi:hypothetical protein